MSGCGSAGRLPNSLPRWVGASASAATAPTRWAPPRCLSTRTAPCPRCSATPGAPRCSTAQAGSCTAPAPTTSSWWTPPAPRCPTARPSPPHSCRLAPSMPGSTNLWLTRHSASSRPPRWCGSTRRRSATRPPWRKGCAPHACAPSSARRTVHPSRSHRWRHSASRLRPWACRARSRTRLGSSSTSSSRSSSARRCSTWCWRWWRSS
mmetsp:Transcript_16570/g.52685  ORF Transcript_16570/g.52685 Transcript_16570/m.52685 type:complete len:207 (-) Transcript_16570:1000-1620(-)